MGFDACRQIAIERERQHAAESARPQETTGPARDLRDLRSLELARLLTVELAQRRERDVLYVQVQAHADGVSRNQRIDLTRLEQSDLGVPRARRKCTQHDRRAATQAPE